MNFIRKSVLCAALVFLPLTTMAGGDKAMAEPADKKMSKEYARDIPDHWRSQSTDNELESRTTVKMVQNELNNNGFDLDVDGILGERTKQALRTFQKELGIAATGRINDATLTALNVGSLEYDRSPASIYEEKPADTSDSMPKTQ